MNVVESPGSVECSVKFNLYKGVNIPCCLFFSSRAHMAEVRPEENTIEITKI